MVGVSTRIGILMRRFLISDLHFGHSNIIKFCGRPYSVIDNKYENNVEELTRMEEDIIAMFDKLPDDCEIYNLGDVFYFGSTDFKKIVGEVYPHMQDLVRRMKGNRKMYLILGNHDRYHVSGQTIVDFYKELGFDEIHEMLILDDKYLLTHKPYYLGDKDLIEFYGHTHENAISPEYFTYDIEDYLQLCKVAKARHQPIPEKQIAYTERMLSEEDYKRYINVCYDYKHDFTEI